MRARRWVVVPVAAAALTAACAGQSEGSRDVGLVLDFVPGGIHAGIYSAVKEGYFEQGGLEVDILAPASSADTLRLVTAGQATIGIAPLGDVAALRSEGEDVQVFLALEQVPLVSLISTEAIGITHPAQLANRTIGVTGVPSDEAIARFILASAGVESGESDFITIGFDAVANLISRSVDAAVGFWSAEVVALELEGEQPVVFRPEDFGAPPFPELVFFATESTLEAEAVAVEAFTAALEQGYAFALENPDAAIQHLVDGSDGVDAAFARAEFEAVSPAFLADDGSFGAIEEALIDDYLEWAGQVGIVASPPENLLTRRFMP